MLLPVRCACVGAPLIRTILITSGMLAVKGTGEPNPVSHQAHVIRGERRSS
ncbi:putative replicative clamp [Pseudomonas phage PIP]|nr:putative replicative clamp [Pseudomonas phage PIP]